MFIAVRNAAALGLAALWLTTAYFVRLRLGWTATDGAPFYGQLLLFLAVLLGLPAWLGARWGRGSALPAFLALGWLANLACLGAVHTQTPGGLPGLWSAAHGGETGAPIVALPDAQGRPAPERTSAPLTDASPDPNAADPFNRPDGPAATREQRLADARLAEPARSQLKEIFRSRDAGQLKDFFTRNARLWNRRPGPLVLLTTGLDGLYPTTEMLQSVLDQKVDLEWTDGSGRSALHLAAQSPDPDLVRCLLAAGAKTEARDSSGNTPLQLARTTAAALALLEAGAKADVSNAQGRTPLHGVAFSREGNGVWSEWTMDALLWKGASLAAQDRDGNTALHLAARESRANLVALLLVRGARPDVKNRDGKRPADLTSDRTCRLYLENPSGLRSRAAEEWQELTRTADGTRWLVDPKSARSGGVQARALYADKHSVAFRVHLTGADQPTVGRWDGCDDPVEADAFDVEGFSEEVGRAYAAAIQAGPAQSPARELPRVAARWTENPRYFETLKL